MEIIKISALSLNYDVQTDALYLEGFEVGYKQGFEVGYKQGLLESAGHWNKETVTRMLQIGGLTKEEIAFCVDVEMTFVLQVERDLLGSSKN